MSCTTAGWVRRGMRTSSSRACSTSMPARPLVWSSKPGAIILPRWPFRRPWRRGRRGRGRGARGRPAGGAGVGCLVGFGVVGGGGGVHGGGRPFHPCVCRSRKPPAGAAAAGFARCAAGPGDAGLKRLRRMGRRSAPPMMAYTVPFRRPVCALAPRGAALPMIITSLLDTDLYKFTMMQVVLHQFPGAQVEYRFKCRNPGVQLAPYVAEIRGEIRSLCSLQFQDAELDYLRSMRFIKSDFVDFLGLFRLNEKYISVAPRPGGEIDIYIRRPWLPTILFEIPVLAIVNEVYFRTTQKVPDFPEGRRRLDAKIALLQAEGLEELKIADYGTRRRFSRAWHEEVLRVLVARLGTGDQCAEAPAGPGQFAGTSNVLYEMKLGVAPLGTMAHEYLQACQALGPRLRDSQVFGFEIWAREYRGDLGIALSDVYGMSAFLRDFDLYFCKLFDGARQDSGDPFAWGERLLAHYRKLRVDPQSKTLIFSDALTVTRTIELYRQFRGRCQLAFGIGTHLTNDLGSPPAHEPLQVVIKMTRCNGQPVAKLADSPGKGMCDDEKYLAYLRQVFDIPAPA